MKNLIPSSSALLRGALPLVALFGFAATPAYSAGPEPSTSAYATIQPNVAGTHIVYTVSWVARDTMYNSGVPSIYTQPYGNAGGTMDNPYVFGDNNYTFDNTANGGNTATTVNYFNTGLVANTTTIVRYLDPLNTTIGYIAPATATPKWEDLGNFSDLGNITYGSGIQTVTGVFSANPNGSGASTGNGVGSYVDEDGGLGADEDDLGILLSGFTNATGPKDGYVQVVVPMSTTFSNPQVETATVKAADFQKETLTLSGNVPGVAQVETATIAGTILAAALQKETLSLSGAVTASGGGTLNIIVTAAGQAWSPKTVPVTVTNSSSTTTQATAVRDALIADADIGAPATGFFTVTSSGAGVILTAKAFAPNDTTMNVASSPFTCVGPTAVANSANTTVGSAGNGNALITVTGALINSGTPLAVNVAVANADTAALVAGKVRTALGLQTTITDFYTVGGSSATVTLTKKVTFNANDTTLNIAYTNGTCSGLTPNATSANTTLGVAGGGGILNVIVTAAGMTNSPKTVPVTVIDGSTTTTQATAVAAALNGDPDVSPFFTATSSAATVILTANAFAANDPTMNFGAFPSTCVGPLESPISQNTTSGGTIAAGDATVTVTGVDINGGVPLAVSVALVANETSTSATTKIITALSALPAITTNYSVTAAPSAPLANTVRLTRTGAPTTFFDGTLNIAIANGTTTGLVEKPTSAGSGDAFTDYFFPGTYTNNGSIQLLVTTDPNYVPKTAVSGDFDSDLDVQADDLAKAAANFNTAAGTGKFYRHGNVDGDTDVDNADLGYVIGSFAAAPGTPPTPSGSATLTYDPANGNVKLNATTAGGAKITSFQLQTSAATIVTANYTAVAGGTYNGTYKNVTTSVIGDTDTSLAGVTGSAIDLGNVFPTGMDLTQLTAYLTTRVYTGESGTRQQQLTLAVASVATLDHFAISAIASPQTEGTAITGITLTARDATNATFTGFTGTVNFSGSAGITGTSASFVNGALSGVSVTPTVAGSNLTFTVTDPVSGKTGSTTIATVQTRYAAWSGGALANVDTNSDGVLNGVAWVVGAANPSASATALQPTSDITTDPNFLTFTYRRTDKANTDSKTAIAVEYGSDLSGWTTAVHDGTNIIITPADDGAGVGIDLVQVKIKKTLAVGSSLFARLKVVITP